MKINFSHLSLLYSSMFFCIFKFVLSFRREQGNCQICFSAATLTDVQLGGKNTKGIIGTPCCGYGTKGTKTTGSDCIQIPNLTLAPGTVKPSMMCGGKGGLVTATGTTSKTVCCKFFLIVHVQQYREIPFP